MTTSQFLTAAWTWNPGLLLLCAAALAAYLLYFGRNSRIGYFLAALGIFLLALLSPLNTLARGYLFSAHMLQHILLLLIVPALLLLSLPRGSSTIRGNPLAAWMAGVGAMWLWHMPALCDAAATSQAVYALQTFSLLAAGAVFWWQVLAPREDDRLSPGIGILYLFTACTACTVLGIIVTFSPVAVCGAYVRPADPLGLLGTIRGDWAMTSDKDQQIGGLLMWVPTCMIYLTAVLAQLARWYSAPAPAGLTTTLGKTG